MCGAVDTSISQVLCYVGGCDLGENENVADKVTL